MSGSATLKLSVSEAGVGSVSLNGMDIGHLTTAIEFKCKKGSLTEIKLTILAELDAEVSARLDQIALAKEADVAPRKIVTADGQTKVVRSRQA